MNHRIFLFCGLLATISIFDAATKAAAQDSDLSIDLTSNTNALVAADARSTVIHRLQAQLFENAAALNFIESQLPPPEAQRSDSDRQLDVQANQLKIERERLRTFLFLALTAPPNLNPIPYLLVGLPVAYNTNPGLVGSNAVASGQFDPKLQLHELIPLGSLAKMTFLGSFDLDRYPHDGAANANNAQSVVKTTFDVPYMLWQLAYKSGLSPGYVTSTTNDLGGGASLTYPKPTTEVPIPPNSVSVDMNITRRFTSSGVDSDSVYLQGVYRFYDLKSFSAALSPSVRIRRYDDSGDSSRRDTTVTVPLQLAWYPDELFKKIAGTCIDGVVQLAAQWIKNHSTVSSKSASQWMVGPTVQISFWDNNYLNCDKAGHARSPELISPLPEKVY